MLEKRHTLIFILFVALSFVPIFVSLNGNWEGGKFINYEDDKLNGEKSQKSYFKDINYHILKGEKKFLQLDSSSLEIDHKSSDVIFLVPKGVAYTNSGSEIQYEGGSGIYNEKSEHLKLAEEVTLNLGESLVTGSEINYYFDKDLVQARGDVVTTSHQESTGDSILIKSQEATLEPSFKRSSYRGDVQGRIKRERPYEPGVDFSSSVMKFNALSSQMDLIGKVSIKKQQLRASSRKGEIFLENYNKKLKYFVLYDDVRLVEQVSLGGKTHERQAFAERLEGITREDKVILTGLPKVFQLDDVIKGNKIILRENNEVIEVDDANTNFKLR